MAGVVRTTIAIGRSRFHPHALIGAWPVDLKCPTESSPEGQRSLTNRPSTDYTTSPRRGERALNPAYSLTPEDAR